MLKMACRDINLKFVLCLVAVTLFVEISPTLPCEASIRSESLEGHVISSEHLDDQPSLLKRRPEAGSQECITSQQDKPDAQTTSSEVGLIRKIASDAWRGRYGSCKDIIFAIMTLTNVVSALDYIRTAVFLKASPRRRKGVRKLARKRD